MVVLLALLACSRCVGMDDRSDLGFILSFCVSGSVWDAFDGRWSPVWSENDTFVRRSPLPGRLIGVNPSSTLIVALHADLR